MTIEEMAKECLDVDDGGKQLHFELTPPKHTAEDYGILTEEQLALVLGIEPLTLSRWRREGTGPKFSKPGKKVYYQVKHVILWLDKCADGHGPVTG